MTAEERKHRIEAYLQGVEFASLEELSQHVGVSTSTVRRDLTVLEAAGSLRRTHGGARVLTPKTDEFAFSARDSHQFSEKEAIGRACAGNPVALIIPCHRVLRGDGKLGGYRWGIARKAALLKQEFDTARKPERKAG